MENKGDPKMDYSNKNALLTAVKKATPVLPNSTLRPFFKGDGLKIAKTLYKQKDNKENIFPHGEPKLEWHKISDLEPMYTQRYTDEKWIDDVLKERGLDMTAFQTLSVARDPRNGKKFVWDGLGRLMLASLKRHNDTLVPCVVYEMEWEKAAEYFSYTQSKGKRPLTKETIFLQDYTVRNKEAVELADVLDYAGAYTKGKANKEQVPEPHVPGTVELTFRGINEAYFKITKKDKSLIRKAIDMIKTAYSQGDQNCVFISNEMFWAVLSALKHYPKLGETPRIKNVQHYLNRKAEEYNQNKLVKLWKKWTDADGKEVVQEIKGLSGNVGVSKILAYSYLKSYKDSDYCNGTVKNYLTSLEETFNIQRSQ